MAWRRLPNGFLIFAQISMAAFAKPLLCAGRFISTKFNLKTMLKEYRKTATVKAKLFEKGDEDGFVHRDGMLGSMEDAKYGLQPDLVPYISTLENQFYKGEFGQHYICVGVKGERWLVEKSIFESTYEELK